LLSPQLRAIFGEKAADVRGTSLRMPSGDFGTVVEVRIFNRHGIEKDERSLKIERDQIDRLTRDRDDEFAILRRNVRTRLRNAVVGKVLAKKMGQASAHEPLMKEAFDKFSFDDVWKLVVVDEKAMADLEALRSQFDAFKKSLTEHFEDKVKKIQRGDDLLPGVMKMVRVFVAVKRKLQPGDKMAGRHGNKGVISKVLPIEDMPFLEDGTPLDIVLNPLGVPSRMNVGQILETHLGWAAAGIGKIIGNCVDECKRSEGTDGIQRIRSCLENLCGEEIVKDIDERFGEDKLMDVAEDMRNGVRFATPVFDGAKEADIVHFLEKAGLDSSGQMNVYDGRTGEIFSRKVTVGYKYLLKLHHLVDDKIHARSTGPYSLVTQQPLGGKAQFGGQRFGEMEVWALEAYGAAYTLQEFLTVKSDDVAGRTKVYESIVKGENNFETGIPESFNVLIKEIRSLGLNIELLNNDIDESEGSNESLCELECDPDKPL
jgi:DNA-directed RNA polymerase subunit beta